MTLYLSSKAKHFCLVSTKDDKAFYQSPRFPDFRLRHLWSTETLIAFEVSSFDVKG